MKISRVIKWGFIPEESGIMVLNVELGRKLWGAIRTNHIVDQHFDDRCLDLITKIWEKKPGNGIELQKMAKNCGLGCFGTELDKGAQFGPIHSKPDMEWWEDLYQFMFGMSDIKMEYPE